MQFLLCYPRISPTVNTVGASNQPVRLVSRIDEALNPRARAVMQRFPASNGCAEPLEHFHVCKSCCQHLSLFTHLLIGERIAGRDI
jgi:hypothetical protein